MENKPRLDISDIWMANHIDDNDKKTKHPFLIVAIIKNKAWGLQFSSFKKQKDGTYKSYFTKNENNDSIYQNLLNTLYYSKEKETIELDVKDGLEWWSEADCNSLYVFNLKNSIIREYNFEYIEQLTDKKFYEIIKLLSNKNWNNSILQNDLLKTKNWLEEKLNIRCVLPFNFLV